MLLARLRFFVAGDANHRRLLVREKAGAAGARLRVLMLKSLIQSSILAFVSPRGRAAPVPPRRGRVKIQKRLCCAKTTVARLPCEVRLAGQRRPFRRQSVARSHPIEALPLCPLRVARTCAEGFFLIAPCAIRAKWKRASERGDDLRRRRPLSGFTHRLEFKNALLPWRFRATRPGACSKKLIDFSAFESERPRFDRMIPCDRRALRAQTKPKRVTGR